MHTHRLSSSASTLYASANTFRHKVTHQQVRHATLIRRPKRPYTFTQLVTLSDGSSYLQRTTSPEAVYTSTKDARNSAMWNPSNFKLTNVEEDEAGKLRKFRERFGRGWDAKTASSEASLRDDTSDTTGNDSLLDLINEANGERQSTGKEGLEAREEEQRLRSTNNSK